MVRADVDAIERCVLAWARASPSDASHTRGMNLKSCRWALDDFAVDARAFGEACERVAKSNASEKYCASDLVVVRYVTTMEAEGGGRATRLTAETPSGTEGDVVVAGLVRASGDGKVDVGLVFEDERVRKAAMHGAAPGVSNAFRENACGAVRCAQATRNGAAGRRGIASAVNGTKPHGTENKPPVAGATTTTTAVAGGSTSAAKGKKDESAAKQKDAGATKSNSLMSMFANAKPKAKVEETKTATAAKPIAAKVEPKKQATPVKPKVPTNADEAILAAEDDSAEDDSDDEFGEAKRKPRRKRAMAIDSEEEEDEEEVDVMEIVDDPPPAPTPTPKKKPSTPRKTPPSTKRKVPETTANEAHDDVDDEEENDAPSEPNSRPQSASKNQKKEKALSKKALLARRIKKTIEHMDEETGEEVMRTIWVDEFDNELNEDGTFKDPENVRTAA